MTASFNEWLQGALGRERTLRQQELDDARRHPQGQQVLSMLERTIAGTQTQVIAGLDAFAAEVQQTSSSW